MQKTFTSYYYNIFVVEFCNFLDIFNLGNFCGAEKFENQINQYDISIIILLYIFKNKKEKFYFLYSKD